MEIFLKRMTYREKLLVGGIVYLLLFAGAWPFVQAPIDGMFRDVLLLLLIFYQYRIGRTPQDRVTDERDALIEARATGFGYNMLIVVLTLTFIALWIDPALCNLRAVSRIRPVDAALTLLILAGLTKSVAQLVLYRKSL